MEDEGERCESKGHWAGKRISIKEAPKGRMRRPSSSQYMSRLAVVAALGLVLLFGMTWMRGSGGPDHGPMSSFSATQSRTDLAKVQQVLESIDNRLLRLEARVSAATQADSAKPNVQSPKPLVKPAGRSKPSELSIEPITMEWAEAKVATLSEAKLASIRSFYSALSIPSVSESLKDGDVVVDIGANLGKFSQQIRQKCPGCIIVAFEALPEYAAYMMSRVQNGEQTYVFPYGLSNSRSKAKFFADDSNLGWNTLVGSMTQPGMRQIDVDLVRLDDVDFDAIVPNFFSRVKLVKIDTEGAEGFVIAGGHAFFESLDPKPPIYLEVAWGAGNSPNWAHATQQFEWLFAHGYNRFDYASIRGTVDVIVRPS